VADLIDADLSDPGVFRHGPPVEVFRALRERDPVHFNPTGFVGESFWSLTRWEECSAGSKDTVTFSSTGGSTIPGTAALGDIQKLMMRMDFL
jgi:cholest-4-en-3-one 26-monooxygenase